jgi:5-methylcytosine-specific restriction enzyme subunit McrC
MGFWKRGTGRPLAVLDTKYKTDERPDTADLLQIVAHAEAVGCQEVILVYPAEFERPFCAPVGEITVRGLTFRLEGDIEEAGRDLLARLTVRGAPASYSESSEGG